MDHKKLICDKYTPKNRFLGVTTNLIKLYFMADPYLDKILINMQIDKKKYIKMIKNIQGAEMENFIVCKYKGINIGLIIFIKLNDFLTANLKNKFILLKMVNDNNKKILINHFKSYNLKFLKNSKNESIYITKISVLPEYQSKGVASKLLKKSILNTKKDIYLHVEKNNNSANEFYKKNSFKSVLIDKNYILKKYQYMPNA